MREPNIARRMKGIVPFHLMELLARARELEARGRSIIHMEVGEPDFPTPQPVIAACKAAIDSGHTGYTPASGIPELRRAISNYYQTRFGIAVNPRRVIVTPGASGALQLVLGVLINPGQEILQSDPGYPCNRNLIEFALGIPVTLPVGPETDFQLRVQQVKDGWTAQTRAVMLSSPANPTGTLISLAELSKIQAAVKKLGGTVIVDESYQGLEFDEKSSSALELGEDLFVVNSFSNYFGMTGWRLGWIVAPDDYVESLDRLTQNIFISCSAPAQYGALAAFSPGCLQICEMRRREFHTRRDYLLEALQKIGFYVPVVPKGSFYLYADCASLTNDSFIFAHALLEMEGVAVAPGRDFGSNYSEQHLRFAYTEPIEKLQEAVSRITRFIKQRNG